MLSEAEVAEMLAQAQEQSGTPTVTNTTVPTTKPQVIVEGAIIEPKEPEYKTEEQLRAEAVALALETEKLQEITTLEARLLEDNSLTEEDKVGIQARLKELQPEEQKDKKEETTETPEQTIARLKKELEDAKKVKDVKEPLAEVEAKAIEKGIDIPELYKEYVSNGELSEASLKSLLDAGFNEVSIDAYINTKIGIEQAKAETIISETVGTRDNYEAMAVWMRDNLKPEEITKYDAGVNTEHAKIYIENMYAKYTKATTAPIILRDNGHVREGNQNTKGFKSLNEQNLALADARYGNDTKYTAEVRRKIMESTYS